MSKNLKNWTLIFAYTILGLAVAFIKFNHCRVNFFNGYESISHACYSDIAAHYSIRFSDGLHHWPYTPYFPEGKTTLLNGFEYPVVIGFLLWIFTFITPEGNHVWNAWTNFFIINAIAISILFIASALILSKIIGTKYVKFYALAPAVLFSLFLNWDMWVVVPMLISILTFEKNKRTWSSVTLALAIATKFFPIFLLIPIFFIDFRRKQLKKYFRFVFEVVIVWIFINVPVAIINFEGWSYFYKFSYTRWLGDGSFYNIFQKFGLKITFSIGFYYFINIAVFVLLILFLAYQKNRISLIESSYLTIFAFTIFGKVYSMQYILWLTPLAVMSISKLPRKEFSKSLKLYFVWQISEVFMHFSYFLNLFWNGFGAKQKGVSDQAYALFAAMRYLSIITFTLVLAIGLLRAKEVPIKNKHFKR